MSEIEYKMSSVAEENIGIDNVAKRDGTLAPFDSTKIYNAINKAGIITKEFGLFPIIPSFRSPLTEATRKLFINPTPI